MDNANAERSSRPSMAFWAAAVIGVTAASISPNIAFACSCSPTPLHQSVHYGAYVFYGTAVKATMATQPNEHGYRQTTLFQIDTSWKGDASGTVTFETLDDTTCGVRFREGEYYVVAASRNFRGTFETSSRDISWDGSEEDVRAMLDAYRVKVAAINRAVGANPADLELRRRKIAFLLDYDDLIAAIGALSDLIPMAPNEAAPLTERGTTYFRLERFDEARRDFQAALSLAPDSLEAKQGLAATEQLSKIDDPTWSDVYNAWPDLYRPQIPEPADAFDRDKMCQAEDVSWWIGDMDAVFGNNRDQGRKVLNGLLRIFTRPEYGCTANVRQLLAAGADPNTDAYIGTSEPFPIVMVAYANEHPDVVIALLEYGANPNVQTNWGSLGERLAQTGLKNGYERAFEVALEKGLDPNAGYTAFTIVSDGHANALRQMLVHGLNANLSWAGASLLEQARSKGHDDIVQILREAGAREE
jgi:tetratricopeptide (TPR) repeat protein